jgi:hypothetical protein
MLANGAWSSVMFGSMSHAPPFTVMALDSSLESFSDSKVQKLFQAAVLAAGSSMRNSRFSMSATCMAC